MTNNETRWTQWTKMQNVMIDDEMNNGKIKSNENDEGTMIEWNGTKWKHHEDHRSDKAKCNE